jgi:hypothetical protein
LQTKKSNQRLSVDLHHVLQPKITKPVRSTKALTLPDDFELVTSKRIAVQAAAAEQVKSVPGSREVPHDFGLFNICGITEHTIGA